MNTARSLVLAIAAAIAEIQGTWLVRQGVRAHHGRLWIGGGFISLGIDGLAFILQSHATSVRSSRPAVPCSCRLVGLGDGERWLRVRSLRHRRRRPPRPAPPDLGRGGSGPSTGCTITTDVTVTVRVEVSCIVNALDGHGAR